MKKLLLLSLTLSIFMAILSVSSLAEGSPTSLTGSDLEVTAEEMPATDNVTSWEDVMRIFLEKYGKYQTNDEIETVLLSRRIDPSRPMVALTFDDGPLPGVTDQILDILEEYNARATFFVIGCRLKKEANASILPRMLALGCEIGNHTYNHEKLKNVSSKYQKSTIKRVNDAVFDITGFYPTSLRPPGGMTGNRVIKNAGEIGMTVVLWSQSGNVHLTSPEAIADNVFLQSANGRKLQSGDIVLLHDTNKSMVNAVRILLPRLIDEGYQLVTVRELLTYCDIGYRSGYQYRSLEDYKTND